MNRTLFLLLLFSNSLFAQVNLNQGLVAYYPFSGNANDQSGNNNNPGFNNATLTADRFGNPNSAYSFNGIDNYIQIPNSPSLNPTNQISLCAWVKASGFYLGPCHGNSILMKGDADYLPGNYHLRFDDNAYTNGQNCINSTVDIIHENFYGVNSVLPPGGYNPFIQTGQWYSVVYIYDGTNVMLYVNCKLIETNSVSGLSFNNGYDLFLGRLNDPQFPYWFNGVMDEVRIYNRPLNDDEVKAYGDCSTTVLNCNNWLYLPSQSSYVNVGDLDIPGNQITVEAMINRTTPYIGGSLYAGDIVSKHDNPGDANYLLRPNEAEITTTNGYFRTPDICEIELNKTYHVAMVYDGSTLKFYRNGFLMSQVAATGDLFQNNWQTRIGYYQNQVYNTNFIGYINEVRIWNVARTQSEIQAYMNTSLPSPTTQPGLLAYYTFNDLTNKQGNVTWNGALGGSATIPATNPNCNFIVDSCSVIPCNKHSDFAIQQNSCSPLSVSFLSSDTAYNSIVWDFGDGNQTTSTLNPSHLYGNYGNYPIKMILNYDNNCNDTIVKTITLDIQTDNQLTLTPDTTICFGTSKQLRTKPSLNFCWNPTTYLDDPNSPNPKTSTPQNITYYFTAQVTGTNIITNEDFSNGNTGFTSEYSYANPNITEGQYFVGTNPQAWNAALSTCKDHTSSSGNMLLVNGSPTPNVNIWKQTVIVVPNTNYAFSTWIQALWPPNPAQLQFSINGKDIGNLITASLPTCTWTQFYTTWNSGGNTTAIISIVNKNTQIQGNDFALDDISFAPVYIKQDSVVISVEKPVVNAFQDTAVCQGIQVALNATGATNYSWSPAAGLDNSNISNPIATPLSTTQYIVAGTTPNGCTGKDTVNIIVYQRPVIVKSNDTTICKNSSVQLFAGGGIIYDWSPSVSLNNNSIPNPIATPTTNTTYYITVTDNNTCTKKDSINISILPDPFFTISNPTNVCQNSSVQLTAAGGNLYSWQPAISLNDPAIANPFASPQTTTNYSVLIIDTVCNNTSTLSTIVTVLSLPVIKADKSNDLDCSHDFSQLNATGAMQYSWSPANTLSDHDLANPVAKPTTETLYIVKGTDANGCVNYDSVMVNITAQNKSGYYMPSAFSPNNDGLNDCYEIKYWGLIEELDFGIYNRWGERIFHTNNPTDCWDGTYKGVKQDPGVFVYLITAKTLCGKVFKKGTFVLIR